MIADIYKTIKHRISNETGLDTFWFSGQYEQSGAQMLFEREACFVELTPINFLQRGLHAQEAILYFNIHIIQETLGGDDARILDIEHLQKVDEVFVALQGFSARIEDIPNYTGPPNSSMLINPIERTSLITDHRLTNLLVTIMGFKTNIWDYQALPKTVPVNPQIILSTIIKHS